MRSSCGKNNYLFLLDVFLHCFLPRHTNIINKVTTSYQHFQKKKNSLESARRHELQINPACSSSWYRGNNQEKFQSIVFGQQNIIKTVEN
jgi:hypothetical protein